MSGIVKQEKTDKELTNYANRVIDLLEPLNPVEKFKVVDGLFHSLLDVLKQEGIVIQFKKEKMKTCVRCGKDINLKEDKYTLIGTYIGKKTKQESYFHFNCWVLYCEKKITQKAQSMIQSMQKKIMPMVKEMFGVRL